jgi:23S rRNA maturation-related 3'-5' exoribonuclease YhaM
MANKGTFFVLQAKEELTKTKKRYFKLQLKRPLSEGGEIINGKIWEEVLILLQNQKIELPKSGQVWEEVFYDNDSYEGHPQLIIRRYAIVQNSATVKELFRDPPVIDVNSAIKHLFLWDWWNPTYQQFFKRILQEFLESGLLEKLKDAPAGSSNHHNRRGGLLQHIREMETLAQLLCQVTLKDTPNKEIEVQGPPSFKDLNIDYQLLRASIILHDLGKLLDYNTETLQFEPVLEGKLLQHSQWGLILIERNWPKEGDPLQKLHLQHCVLSHHGRSIAPVGPLTAEAMILHHVDGISAYLDVHRSARSLTKAGSMVPYNGMLGDVPIIIKSCD